MIVHQRRAVHISAQVLDEQVDVALVVTFAGERVVRGEDDPGVVPERTVERNASVVPFDGDRAPVAILPANRTDDQVSERRNSADGQRGAMSDALTFGGGPNCRAHLDAAVPTPVDLSELPVAPRRA